MSTCRSCDAEVVFVASEKTGRPMILNAKPEKRVLVGNFSEVSEGDGFGLLLIDGYIGPPGGGSVAVVVDVYTDHHATCPNAADWKGKHR